MQNVAFRCGLIAFLCISSVSYAVAKYPREQRADNNQRYSEHRQPGAEPSWAWPVSWQPPRPTAIPGDDTSKPGVYEYKCYSPQTREDADACQQRRSAQAAEDQWWVSVFGLIASIAAAFFTGWAAFAAAAAAKAAAGATEEACRANEIARDTSARELRAYVFASHAVLRKEPNSFKATVTIQNFGQTPAYKFDHFAIIEGTGNPRTAPFIGGEFDIERTACIPPGSHVGVVCETSRIPDSRMNDIETGRGMLWVWGEIHYEDAFGRHQTTKYRFKYNGASAQTEGKGVMMTDREGNEAT